MKKRRRRRPPWYHRLSPLTWAVLWLTLAASVSLVLSNTWRSAGGSKAPQVQVLNGTGVPDLARSVAETLRDRGLDVVSVGNADADSYQNTIVLVRRGHPAVAQRVARALGAGTPLEQRDPTLLVDVTLILGHDYVRARDARVSGRDR